MTEDYQTIEQIELAIKAAERTVGQATMSMDEDQLNNATMALEQAKKQLEQAKMQNMNHETWQYSTAMINRLSHQVEEAKE
ncbi:hypothetical protein CR194_06785 [Salipaludibacillus keqinensis]|uniref:DUF2564 domain-containing protein n=1 Tax=Salipaludibacillus keqinensis TaxID=2045207 RepID=A0A323U051_9BACI|nr:DUF2564 family protein [Salipaludibacillus keqinensis]PYZ95215.1 hypothetical protein CR194_06785 [Salipaludibacillus keqinensis]